MTGAPRTRFAPTPSGYLHLGNALSFVFTWLLARRAGGAIHLRIDDLDAARLRPEYLADVFVSLDWLGLEWDSGPRDAGDFLAHHSQRLRMESYREALGRLATTPRADGGPSVYACVCSRQQVRRDALLAGRPGAYAGTCRERELDLATPGAAWRLALDEGAEVVVADLVAGPLRLVPGASTGDPVVRQKTGEPAYHLASVVDDEALGCDLIVRGSDLLDSTAVQLVLARRLGAAGFTGATFVHHGLVVAADAGDPAAPGSAKLSKSAGEAPAAGGALLPWSLRALRDRLGVPGPVFAFAADLLGIDSAGCRQAGDLLAGFDPAAIPTTPITWERFPGGGRLP
jgi:glutamyl/glutaminyl-tRNA synthetase